MFRKPTIVLASLCLCATLASSASADQFGISIGKQGKHGSFQFQWSNGAHHEPNCAPPHFVCPPNGYIVHCAAPIWVPAHYDTVIEQVFFDARNETAWIDPVYEVRNDACGRPVQVCVAPGHWQSVCRPAHYESREVRVWREGSWQERYQPF